MRNLPEWPVALFAGAACGAIVVPLNAWWAGPELAYGMLHSGSQILICDKERWDRMEPHLSDLPDLKHVMVARDESSEATPATRLEEAIGCVSEWSCLGEVPLPAIDIYPDDDLTIFYTSGTTGRPKGALGSHRNMLIGLLSVDYNRCAAAVRRGEEPAPPSALKGLVVAPMFHVTTCNSTLMGAMAVGGALVLMRKWDTLKAFELIEREKIQYVLGVPTIAWQILEHPLRADYDLSSLGAVAFGGAASGPDLARRVDQELHAVPTVGWGMTETSATVIGQSGSEFLRRPGSCGYPLPISDIKIMDPDGKAEMAPMISGELWASGGQVVKGYWNDPEATAATFVNGWVKTGDIATLDDEGFCYIVDRSKDVIIRGGENIYSIEVENVLQAHDTVLEAALIAIPDHVLGEVPVAIVRPRDGASLDESELKAFVESRLARFKVPVRILAQKEELPRNAGGKLIKAEIKERYFSRFDAC